MGVSLNNPIPNTNLYKKCTPNDEDQESGTFFQRMIMKNWYFIFRYAIKRCILKDKKIVNQR